MKKRGKLKIVITVFSVAVLIVTVVFAKRIIDKEILYPLEYEDIIAKYSAMYGVEEELISAVINNESHFDSDAVSAAGAIGLMQITPETFTWLQTKDDTEELLEIIDLYDPEVNIKYGTLLLSLNIAEYGNTQTAIASYNAGRGKVSAWLTDKKYSSDSRTLTLIPYEETRIYVEKVNQSYEVYKDRLGKE